MPGESSRTTEHSSRRPATIAELAERARIDNTSMPLKYWLRTAESSRKHGSAYIDAGDFENAFIEFARAATIVLEKLPAHVDYQALLSPEQRSNLRKNGENILLELGKLKPVLVKRYDEWLSSAESTRPSTSEPPQPESRDGRRTRAPLLDPERAQEALGAARHEQEWRIGELTRRHSSEDRDQYVPPEPSSYSRRHGDGRPREDPARVAERRAIEAREAREAAEHERQARMRREDDARREEEMRRRMDDRRRYEQDGIVRRQQEAEAAARAARHDISSRQGSSSSISARNPPYPEADVQSRPREIAMPVAYPHLQHPSHYTNHADNYPPSDSHNRYDYDSASSDSHEGYQPRHDTRIKPNYPPPVTTTSPPPPDGPIRYPNLMSQHQLKQGYVPSLQSMFSQMSIQPPAGSTLLLDTAPSNEMYPSSHPPPSSAPPSFPNYPSLPIPRPHTEPQQYPPSHVGQRGPSPSGARPRPPIPPKVPIEQPVIPPAPRITPGTSTDATVRELKSVRLPRECLPRFLSIARVNTLKNVETCGLLLGKAKGDKYVVTTLLIPKQHSTSDTCTMDEEELVLSFTEERQLITLGWIHTHPTQSCFMSSVDLHTHSGFQCMLPESFAVVCAPSSNPMFGIFRLTDPEGLQTILQCNAKDAFHPHPEVPIYTDCDNNHVQLKDMPLEIVDIRK